MAKRAGKKSHSNPSVAVVMGSSSDLVIMNEAIKVLQRFGVDCVVEVLSAHRTPERMLEFALAAKESGLQVIIAGAGGAAHLPGMLASATTLPVIGVPIKSKHSLEGIDSLLSIAQMPGGVPVATMAVDGAQNAGLMAVQILALANGTLAEQLLAYKEELKLKVKEMNKALPRELAKLKSV
jgi:5-(carboxyamino)imidazole ribonucleotide mutase